MKKVFILTFIFFALTFSSAKSDWLVKACGLPYDSRIPAMLVKDSLWFAATNYGVFYSVHENEHFTNGTPNLGDNVINCLHFFGDFILAGAEGGSVYISPIITPPSFSRATNNLPAGSSVYSITSVQNFIFLGTKGRNVYFSQDTGKIWTNRSVGLPVNSSGKVYIFSNGTDLYAATDGAGIFKTTDYGISWLAMNTGLTNLNVKSIGFHNNKIFAGTKGSGIFVFSESSQNWIQKNTGLENLNINCFFSTSNRLLAGTDSGVFVSSNNADSWYQRNNGLPDDRRVICFVLASSFTSGSNFTYPGQSALKKLFS